MALEKKHWLKLKRKSPKVPDITCPIIDDIIARLEKHQNKNIEDYGFTKKQILNDFDFVYKEYFI